MGDSDAIVAPPPKPVKPELTPAAREYLGHLLREIGTMLTYARDSGKSIPSDLGESIGELFNNPALEDFEGVVFPTRKRRGKR